MSWEMTCEERFVYRYILQGLDPLGWLKLKHAIHEQKWISMRHERKNVANFQGGHGGSHF